MGIGFHSVLVISVCISFVFTCTSPSDECRCRLTILFWYTYSYSFSVTCGLCRLSASPVSGRSAPHSGRFCRRHCSRSLRSLKYVLHNRKWNEYACAIATIQNSQLKIGIRNWIERESPVFNSLFCWIQIVSSFFTSNFLLGSSTAVNSHEGGLTSIFINGVSYL